MTDNEKRFVEYWQKQKEKGIIRFSLTTGITYAIFVVVFTKVFAWDFNFTQKDIGFSILSLVVGIMGLAPFMWWHRNRKFDKIMSENPPQKSHQKKKQKK